MTGALDGNPRNFWRCCLVDFLLLVHAQLTRSHVHQEQKATHDGKDLEEVVLGEVLVGMILVQLDPDVSNRQRNSRGEKSSPSRSC